MALARNNWRALVRYTHARAAEKSSLERCPPEKKHASSHIREKLTYESVDRAFIQLKYIHSSKMPTPHRSMHVWVHLRTRYKSHDKNKINNFHTTAFKGIAEEKYSQCSRLQLQSSSWIVIVYYSNFRAVAFRLGNEES